MTHNDMIHGMLFEFHDGRLAGDDARGVLRHLGECAQCRATLDAWRRSSRDLLRPLQVESSDVFVRRVMQRVETLNEPSSAPWFRAWPRWTFPGLAFSVASLAIALVASPETAESMDNLFIHTDSHPVSEWVSEPPSEAQLLNAMVEP